MQVFKFGGTSLGSPVRMQRVATLIADDTPKIVVLSAVAGTTDKLVTLNQLAAEGRFAEAGEWLVELRETYESFTFELFDNRADYQYSRHILDRHFQTLEQTLDREFNGAAGRIILAQGELLSTHLFQYYLETQGKEAALLPALDIVHTDDKGEPRLDLLRDRLHDLLSQQADKNCFITQGYICRNSLGEIDNLKRGGSDYTATLIGAAVEAEEIQIWTDIDGLHNNDPRVVEHTYPVRSVSYREAAELAYFGAKILHPTCVLPAERLQIPIRLRNTFAPEAEGTRISNQPSGSPVAAVAAKDGIVAIKIRSHRMLLAYGFLRRVFEVFERYRTPIDMIATSEVAVSLTIDDTTNLEAILKELKTFGEVSVDTEQSIICVVGDNLHQKGGHARRILSALEDTPIRMICYGGSVNNISILVSSEHKKQALQLLNRQIFPKLMEVYSVMAEEEKGS